MPNKSEQVDGHTPDKGYFQMTSLSAATNLFTFVTGALWPQDANMVWVCAEGANVRWRGDGTAPTATVGNLIKIGQTVKITSNLENLQFIQTAASATLNVNFYGPGH